MKLMKLMKPMKSMKPVPLPPTYRLRFTTTNQPIKSDMPQTRSQTIATQRLKEELQRLEEELQHSTLILDDEPQPQQSLIVVLEEGSPFPSSHVVCLSQEGELTLLPRIETKTQNIYHTKLPRELKGAFSVCLVRLATSSTERAVVWEKAFAWP